MVATRAPLATRGFYGGYNRRGRAELKAIDTTASNVALLSGGGVIALNLVAQGSDYNQRIGRKVVLKSVLLRIHVVPTPTVDLPQGDVGRFILAYDAQTNGVSPGVSDLIAGGDYLAGNNLNYRERFKVIKDWMVPLAATAYNTGILVSGVPSTRLLTVYKRLNLDTVFNNTGGAVGQIATGGLFLFYDNGLAAGGYQFNLFSRVRFTDP